MSWEFPVNCPSPHHWLLNIISDNGLVPSSNVWLEIYFVTNHSKHYVDVIMCNIYDIQHTYSNKIKYGLATPRDFTFLLQRNRIYYRCIPQQGLLYICRDATLCDVCCVSYISISGTKITRQRAILSSILSVPWHNRSCRLSAHK